MPEGKEQVEAVDPFRVKVTGATHPHRGATGVCDPSVTAFEGRMVLVSLNSPGSYGVDSCYASPNELEKL